MSVANVRAEIARHYRGALDHVHVYEHGGAFSLEDIKRYTQKSPAVVIGCLGIPSFEFQSTVTVANVSFGAFCIAQNNVRDNRDVAALLLMESVAVETIANRWDGSASQAPRNVSAANLYSQPLDKMGVAMWAVRWDQKVDLQRNAIATLDDFLTMYSTYDVGETDDTETTSDVTELPQ